MSDKTCQIQDASKWSKKKCHEKASKVKWKNNYRIMLDRLRNPSDSYACTSA